MTIDKYRPCPCGSGKKIKFCCSADLLGELDKIQRMRVGEQRKACLEYVNQLLEKHPGVPSLLSIKVALENELGDTEHAEETIKELLQTTPDSPIAFAENARLLAREGKSLDAAEALQDALDAVDEAIPVQIYEALSDVALALLEDGCLFASRAHLLVHASIGGEDDPRSASLLMEMNASGNLPLLVRQDSRFAPCDENAPYKEEFDAAMAAASHARWRTALEKLEHLAEKHGREAPIHRNIALFRSYLGRDDRAALAWQRYAALVAETNLDDAVEAEAIAQLLAPTSDIDEVDVLNLTYEVTDVDRLLEALAEHPRAWHMPVDTSSLAEEGEPPPKAVYSLLDRDMPESGEGLTFDAAPRALCDFYVFGRETDKAARIELTVPQTVVEAAQEAIGLVAAELLVTPPQQECIDKADKIDVALTWSWRWPKNTPREVRAELLQQQRCGAILDIWPTLAQSAFDGKSPDQVRDDAKYQTRLLGAILLLELHGQQNRWAFDYNELRTKLGLPVPSSIDPTAVDVSTVPLSRYARLEASKLTLEQLGDLLQYASLLHAPAAIRVLGTELLLREFTMEELPIAKASVYGLLARVAHDNEEALGLIEKASDEAAAAGQSRARWLLTELPLRIEMGDIQRAQQLVETIQAKYAKDAGVMQSLFQILHRYGLVQPTAAPVGPAPEAALPPETSTAEGLWTPDGGGAQATAEEAGEPAKSGLWLPGMD